MNWPDYLVKISQRMEQATAGMPRCPDCGEPLPPGTICSCKLRLRQRLQIAEAVKKADIKRLGGGKPYEQYTLEKYDNGAAVGACSDYPGCSLYLWGGAGVGKTHLATALVRKYTDGTVLKPLRFLRRLRCLKDPEAEDAVINRLIACRHLVIDDLGLEKKTDYSLSVIYEIISEREANNRTGLIVTSNLSPDALAERLQDDRITSRLAGMCKIIEITGRDRRVKIDK